MLFTPDALGCPSVHRTWFTKAGSIVAAAIELFLGFVFGLTLLGNLPITDGTPFELLTARFGVTPVLLGWWFLVLGLVYSLTAGMTLLTFAFDGWAFPRAVTSVAVGLQSVLVISQLVLGSDRGARVLADFFVAPTPLVALGLAAATLVFLCSVRIGVENLSPPIRPDN